MYVCMYVCTYVEWYIPGTETYYINKYNVNSLKNDMSAYIHTYTITTQGAKEKYLSTCTFRMWPRHPRQEQIDEPSQR